MSEIMENVVKWVTIAVGLILIGIFSMRGLSYFTDYQTLMADYDTRIAETQKELLVRQAELDSSSKNVSTVVDNVHSLNDIGVSVANIQTKYAMATNDYAKSQLYVHDQIDNEIEEYKNQLAEYFDIDDVYLWFDWQEGVTLSWDCLTNYDFFGDTFDVFWTCTSSGSQSYVCAYASAVYHMDTHKFTDLCTYPTRTGLKFVKYVDDTTDVNGFDFSDELDNNVSYDSDDSFVEGGEN